MCWCVSQTFVYFLPCLCLLVINNDLNPIVPTKLVILIYISVSLFIYHCWFGSEHGIC